MTICMGETLDKYQRVLAKGKSKGKRDTPQEGRHPLPRCVVVGLLGQSSEGIVHKALHSVCWEAHASNTRVRFP